MDSNFEGNDMEQWQQVENSPFDEMEELPIPPYETLEESEQQGCEDECELNADSEEISEKNEEENIAETINVEDTEKLKEELEEEKKRAEHEAAETKRKAEWEAKQKEKKEAELREIYRLDCMSDEEVMVESMQRISKDTERLTRRNMKDCVSEHVQTLCFEDAAFARLAMYPKKSMINCFRYINRKAREFIEQEMKDNDIKPENGVYGSDVPDDLCYQWAEDYFRDPDAPEDKTEKEEKFIPKPYTGKASNKSSKKKSAKKEDAKKTKKTIVATEESPEDKKVGCDVETNPEKDYLSGQMSILDFLMPKTKAS